MIDDRQASLLLSSIVALMTTDPPPSSGPILNYTARGPYICILASFGILLGGIIVGGTAVVVLWSNTLKWTRDVSLS
jgi:hypothetical protein